MRLKKFFFRKKTGNIAKDRLKILLISDRVNCSPEMMEVIKADIANVLSKYMKIDIASMEIQINQTGAKGHNNDSNPSLFAKIPILDLRK